jgi:homoserine O-acetyltransferase
MSPYLYQYPHPFYLESGQTITGLEIAYHTYGNLNKEKNNVVWICHALTANSDAADWWHILIGKGKIFDPDKYFIVCANIIGSCYGSSGPLSINPITKKAFYSSFPMATIRDMVQAHILLRKHLGIEKIQMAVGGSMGGYQVLEWSVMEPECIAKMVLLTTSAAESAWGIAIHTAQRLAIEADASWKDFSPTAGSKGLGAARSMGMITYRTYEQLKKTQTDAEFKLDHYKASSYINYQAEKLIKRFNAYSYWLLTKAMDSHHIARNRGKAENVLKQIKTRTLIIGMSSDLLCPIQEQQFLAKHIPDAELEIIHSDYGHDGFLVEEKLITVAIGKFCEL